MLPANANGWQDSLRQVESQFKVNIFAWLQKDCQMKLCNLGRSRKGDPSGKTVCVWGRGGGPRDSIYPEPLKDCFYTLTPLFDNHQNLHLAQIVFSMKRMLTRVAESVRQVFGFGGEREARE